MYVCMYVYIYIYICMYMRVCVCVRACENTRMHSFICARTHTHVTPPSLSYVYMCMYVYMFVRTYVHGHFRGLAAHSPKTYLHVYMHVYVYVYVHTLPT